MACQAVDKFQNIISETGPAGIPTQSAFAFESLFKLQFKSECTEHRSHHQNQHVYKTNMGKLLSSQSWQMLIYVHALSREVPNRLNMKTRNRKISYRKKLARSTTVMLIKESLLPESIDERAGILLCLPRD